MLVADFFFIFLASKSIISEDIMSISVDFLKFKNRFHQVASNSLVIKYINTRVGPPYGRNINYKIISKLKYMYNLF